VQVLWKNKYTFLTNDDLVFLMEFFVYYDILSGVKILVRKQNIIPSISCIDTAMHYGRDKYLFVLFKGIGSICEKDGRDLIDNYKWYRFSKEKNERKCYAEAFCKLELELIMILFLLRKNQMFLRHKIRQHLFLFRKSIL
jgi:hypothetical protein